jgi:serine/threonine-protein kinase
VEQLYEIIERRMGTHGIDLLYELMTTRGGSRAAKRATDLLADPEVRKRGTPALRIAYDLRKTSCPEKNQLFERAREDGDRRALGMLEELKDCRRSRCCLYTKDPALKEAVDALRTRFP